MLIPPESYDPDWWKKQPGPYIPLFMGGVLGRWEVRIHDRRNGHYPVRTVRLDGRPATAWGHAVRLCLRANRMLALSSQQGGTEGDVCAQAYVLVQLQEQGVRVHRNTC